MEKNWSTQAHRWHKAAVSARKTDYQVEQEIAWLLKGPHLDGDLIIIPSPWYKEEATTFWRDELGCRYSAHEKAWCFGWTTAYQRRTCKMGNGKRYTSKQWLASITRKYRELWAEELAQHTGSGRAAESKPAVVETKLAVPVADPEDHFRGNWR